MQLNIKNQCAKVQFYPENIQYRKPRGPPGSQDSAALPQHFPQKEEVEKTKDRAGSDCWQANWKGHHIDITI